MYGIVGTLDRAIFLKTLHPDMLFYSNERGLENRKVFIVESELRTVHKYMLISMSLLKSDQFKWSGATEGYFLVTEFDYGSGKWTGIENPTEKQIGAAKRKLGEMQ